MAPFHHLLPSPENVMAAGLGGLLLAQQRANVQPAVQQRPAQQLRRSLEGRLPPPQAHTLQLLQHPQQQQLPAFWNNFFPRGGLVPHPLQVCASNTLGLDDPVSSPLSLSSARNSPRVPQWTLFNIARH